MDIAHEKTKLDLSKYKGFFFDLDGTLIDSVDVWKNADTELINTYGTNKNEFSLTDKKEFFTTYKGNDLYLDWAQYLITTYEMTDITAMQVKSWQENFGYNFMLNIEYRDSADKILQNLKEKGAKMALVTLASDSVINILKHENKNIKNSADFGYIFDIIITSKNVVQRKPSPECYNKAMELLNLQPSECLVFENDLTGALSAKSAGIDVCIIYDKASNDDRVKLNELTSYQIESFRDLLDKY